MFDFPDKFTLLTYASAFLAVCMLVYGFFEVVFGFRRHQVRKRIDRRLDTAAARARSDEASLVKDPNDVGKWVMARWLAASKRGLSFKKLCDQAALPWEAHHVLAVISLSILAMLAVGLLLKLNPAGLILGALIIVLAPFAFIIIKRNKRLKKFNNQLPEAFELLSQSLRAGHALTAGIQLVAEQMDDPIGTEFSRLHAEQDLGIPMEEAMDHLADRVDLLDLKMFVTAVQIQRQTGGDLAEMMDRIGAVIRDRIKILGQVRALTAEGRLSGWVLMLLPIFVLLMIFQLNPRHPEKLFNTDIGRGMLGVAVLMQVVGMICIHKIVNFKI